MKDNQHITDLSGELSSDKTELAHIVRLALSEEFEDIRLYVARLVRKYRVTDPQFADRLEVYLRSNAPRSSAPLRKTLNGQAAGPLVPIDDESKLSLLKVFSDDPHREPPLLSASLRDTLNQLIEERRQSARLTALGLPPTRSAIFMGKPGVGKTLTARWLASQLQLPLYVLDLTAVMSSLLGRSGTNLRAALDFAKRTESVLLLDEIDAIAKRRSDESDIGELKRLVTVILQEVDEWPPTGLLLAATNHPELIDPALWRRFDLVVEFPAPDKQAIKDAIKRFCGPDLTIFERWIDVLAFAFSGESFSEIEREIQRLRRAVALGSAPRGALMEDFLKSRALTLDRHTRIELAILLSKHTRLSQHAISAITGASRDTIRKHVTKQATASE